MLQSARELPGRFTAFGKIWKCGRNREVNRPYSFTALELFGECGKRKIKNSPHFDFFENAVNQNGRIAKKGSVQDAPLTSFYENLLCYILIIGVGRRNAALCLLDLCLRYSRCLGRGKHVTIFVHVLDDRERCTNEDDGQCSDYND